MAQWSQYFAARVVAAGLNVLDVDGAMRMAGVIGRAIYRFDRRHRRRVADHLAWAYPGADGGWIDATGRGSVEHLVKLVFEICFTPRVIHGDSWSHRVVLGDIGQAVEQLNSGKPTLLITGHVGNWEALGFVLAVLGFEIEALARPLDNKPLNDWLIGIRQKRGLRVLTKWDATDHMLALLGRGGTLGMIADQNAGDRGLFVPFFGKLASTYKSVGLLAMNREATIVCGYAHRVGHGCRYEVGVQDIIRPDDWSGQADPLYYITARYMYAIEQMVRRRPQQYLWMHRRWRSRPRHELCGREVPARMLRNLEGLPWMTQDVLGRIKDYEPVAVELRGSRRIVADGVGG